MGKSNIQNAIEKRGLLKTALLLLPLLLAIGGAVCEKADAATYPILHNSSTANSKGYWSGNGGWGVTPSSKYGRFTCATCHNRSTANIKRIVDTIPSTIGPAVNKPVSFTNVTGQNSYGDDTTVAGGNYTTSTRICEVCHTLTIAHRYDNSAAGVTDKPNHQGASRTDCTTTCHPHSKGFAPAGSCTSCHGNPPTLSTYGGPNGLATQGAYGGNTNFLPSGQAGAHDRHKNQLAMTCNACHTGYTSSPMGSGGIEIGFSVSGTTWPQFTGSALNYGSYTGNSNKAAGYTYVGRNGTVMGTLAAGKNSCNVYCHGGWSGSGKTNPDWIGGAAAVACGKCHGTTPAAAPTRASHPKHASNGTTAYAISCTTCHPSRATGNTAHITGSVQWQLSTGNPRVGATATYNGAAGPASTGTPAPSATYANCTNVYCHSGDSSAGRSYKTVQWGATLAADCSGCHGNDAASAVPIASRAHKAHVNNASASYSGLKFKCNECHNTVVDATNRTLLAGAYGATGLHTNGGTPNVAWGTISNGGGAYAQGATNCGAIYCHSDGGGVYKTPGNWSTYTDSTEGTAACDYCHPGLAGNTTPVSSVKHTAHIRTSGYTIPHAVLKCANCHSRTARFNDSVYTNSTSQHISKTKNVRFSPYWGSVFTNHTGTFVGTTCDNTHCHGNVDAAWSAAGGQKTCGDCHSSKNDGLLSAPHTKHYNSGTAPTTATGWTNTKNGTGNTYVFFCGTCHNVNNLTQHVNGPQVAGQGGSELALNLPGSQGSFTNSATKSGSGVVNDSRMFDYSPNTSCSVYCHSNANEAAPAYRAVTWGGAAKVCGDCHNYSKSAPTRDWSTKHEKHMKTYSSNSIFRCGTCHVGTVLNGTNTTILSTSKRHVDGYRNVSSNATAGNFKYVPATKTCLSVTCHSAGRSGDTRYTNQTWTSAAVTCLSCHGGRNAAQGTPVKSSAGFSLSTTHSQHLGKYPAANMNCNICHAKTASDAATLATYTGVRYHVNNKRDVHFTGITYGTYTSFKSTESGSGGNDKTCKNVSCHGGKSRSAWNTTTINNDNTCVHCHGKAGTLPSNTDKKNFAPGWNGGIDTDGDTVSSNYQVGAHFVHLSSVYMKKLKCNECHIVPSSPFDGGHMAQPRFTLSETLRFDQASSAKYNAVAGTTLSVFSGYTSGTAIKAATCSSVYCHGNRLKYGDAGGADARRKPSWNQDLTTGTPGTAECGRCHGNPPTAPADHTGQTATTSCAGCHPDVVNASGTIINKALHINRTIEKTAGDCMGCHNAQKGSIPRAKIVGALLGSEGDDFVRKSRHVNQNGTTTQIVTNYDCILCHAEGAVTSSGTNYATVAANHGADGGATTIELRNVDSTGGTGVIANWPGKRLASFTATSAQRDAMDNFCLGCHDSNGASKIAVNNTNNGFYLDSLTTTTRSGASVSVALRPFNTNDNLRNGWDSATLGTFRQTTYGRVLNVRDQFNTINSTGTTGYASHHNLNQYAKRYATKNTTYWPAAAWGTATTMDGAALGENVGLHCSDCHLNEANAHGSRNTPYMLQTNAGTDATWTNALNLGNTSTTVCYKCHSINTYAAAGSAVLSSRFPHDNGDTGNLGDNYNPFSINCINCHGGYTKQAWGGLGAIHGTNDSWGQGGDPNGTSGTQVKRYRFLNGAAGRYFYPTTNLTTTDINWETNTRWGCYTLAAGDIWDTPTCTKHNGSPGIGSDAKSAPSQRNRLLNY